MCSGTEMGEQTCNDEGTGFNTCDCSPGGGNGGNAGSGNNGGNAGGTSMAGSTGMPGPVFEVGLIGAPCATDADCSDAVPDFKCIVPDAPGEFGAGSPEGGYCTVPCQTNDDCAPLDGLSACARGMNAAEGFCIALCVPGVSDLKCGVGDRAQACYPNGEQAGIGACFPVCTSDAACAPGLSCDLGDLNLCVETPTPGGGIGEPCTIATEATDCASGTCLEFEDPANPGTAAGGFCTALCAVFNEAGCGRAPGTPETTPRENFCLQPVVTGGRPGDIGFCYELCSVDGDCLQSGWTCDAFGSPEIQTALGRQGQCVPPGVDDDEVADAGPG